MISKASFLNPDIFASEIPKSHKINVEIFEVLRLVGTSITLSLHEDLLRGINIYEWLSDVNPLLNEQEWLIKAHFKHFLLNENIENIDALVVLRSMYSGKFCVEESALVNNFLNHNHTSEQVFIVLDRVAYEAGNVHRRMKYTSKKFSTIESVWEELFPEDFMVGVNLPDEFHNVFLCRASKKSILEKDAADVLRKSRNYPFFQKYCYDYEKNFAACIDNEDCGIDYTWNKIYEYLRSNQTKKNRYKRILTGILPLVKEALNLGLEDFHEELVKDYQSLQNISKSLNM